MHHSDVLIVLPDVLNNRSNRAKGNEAPAVFVVDADYCESDFEIKKKRNILFTAITRSRAWTYISGVGAGMSQIDAEICAIREGKYKLSFTYPSREEAERLAASADQAMSEISRTGDEFDEARVVLQKLEKLGWDQIPPDVRQRLTDMSGQS